MVDMTPEFKAEIKKRLDEIMAELTALEDELQKADAKERSEIDPATRERFEAVKNRVWALKTDLEATVEKMRKIGCDV